jgi:hypothetical protein
MLNVRSRVSVKHRCGEWNVRVQIVRCELGISIQRNNKLDKCVAREEFTKVSGQNKQ